MCWWVSTCPHLLIASLDAEKAFEWGRYGFGPQFLLCLKMLYRAPMACIRTNGRVSDGFLLQWGTRQGCLLYHSPFDLALEHLAIL